MKRTAQLKRRARLRPVGLKRQRARAASRAQTSAVEARAAMVAIAEAAGRAAGVWAGPRKGGVAVDKCGELVSEAWLARVRALPCAFCGAPGPGDPHHARLVSRRRERFDLLAVPACRTCHDRAHAGAIPLARQHQALGELLCTTLRRMARSELREVLAEMAGGLGMEIGK